MKMFDDFMDFIAMNEIMRWFIRGVIAGAITLALLASAGLASADQQPFCDTQANFLARFAKKYQETPTAVGITSKGGLIQVLTTTTGNTWTIVITTPQGMTCVVTAGENWRSREKVNIKKDPLGRKLSRV